MSKGTNQPNLKRMKFVEDMLNENARYGAVVTATVAAFGCGVRTVERDIARVYEQWREVEPDMRIARRESLRAQLEHLYAMATGKTDKPGTSTEGNDTAHKSVDLPAAIRILERLAKLDGVDAPVELDIRAKVGLDEKAAAEVLKFLPAEREKEIRRLEKKMKAADVAKAAEVKKAKAAEKRKAKKKAKVKESKS